MKYVLLILGLLAAISFSIQQDDEPDYKQEELLNDIEKAAEQEKQYNYAYKQQDYDYDGEKLLAKLLKYTKAKEMNYDYKQELLANLDEAKEQDKQYNYAYEQEDYDDDGGELLDEDNEAKEMDYDYNANAEWWRGRRRRRCGYTCRLRRDLANERRKANQNHRNFVHYRNLYYRERNRANRNQGRANRNQHRANRLQRQANMYKHLNDNYKKMYYDCTHKHG